MDFKQTLSSKLAVVGLGLLLIFLGNLKFQQYRKQKQIEIQQKNLQDQTDALQKKNDELTQSLQYLNSDDFKESIARQQLGLKKQDEQVYSFTNGPAPSPLLQTGSETNFKKWLDYFFTN